MLPENGALVLTGSAEGRMPDRVELQGQMVATLEELKFRSWNRGRRLCSLPSTRIGKTGCCVNR